MWQRNYRIGAAAVATLAAIALGQAVYAAPAPELEKRAAPGISNFTELTGSDGFAGEAVAFGGATAPDAMAWLSNEGYKTVINLRLPIEEGVELDASREAAQAAGLNYVHLPFSPGDPDPTVVENFLAAVGNDANQPVYIHCGSATRVAALWMIGRVLEDGKGVGAATGEAQVIAGAPERAVAFATEYLQENEGK